MEVLRRLSRCVNYRLPPQREKEKETLPFGLLRLSLPRFVLRYPCATRSSTPIALAGLEKVSRMETENARTNNSKQPKLDRTSMQHVQFKVLVPVPSPHARDPALPRTTPPQAKRQDNPH